MIFHHILGIARKVPSSQTGYALNDLFLIPKMMLAHSFGIEPGLAKGTVPLTINPHTLVIDMPALLLKITGINIAVFL